VKIAGGLRTITIAGIFLVLFKLEGFRILILGSIAREWLCIQKSYLFVAQKLRVELSY
jgi:hypothetical protein